MKDTAEAGFILVATLWFVALLALAAIVIEGWIASALERGAALGERVAAHSALLGAEQRIAFIMAGGSFSARGLELKGSAAASEPDRPATPLDAPAPEAPFIALDDRPYRIGDVVVRLQDGAGLYDINNADRGTLGRLLDSFGLANEDGEKLAGALLDYVGEPSDIRASSIRGSDYLRAALPLPRHAPLLTPWEPLRVLGWAGTNPLWRGSSLLPEITTPGPMGSLNVNTASARVLAALTGMDEREAARLVLSRASRPITDPHDVKIDPGVFNGEDRTLVFMPSNIVRLKMTEPGAKLMRVMEVRLTPLGKAPYRVDYVVDMPRDGASRAAIDAPPLPSLWAAQQIR